MYDETDFLIILVCGENGNLGVIDCKGFLTHMFLASDEDDPVFPLFAFDNISFLLIVSLLHGSTASLIRVLINFLLSL